MPATRYGQLTWYEVDPSGCWLWTASIDVRGYGHFRHKGSLILAHRHFYEHHVGPIPDAMVIDHLCFVRHCVNPDHLQVTTRSKNSRRQQSTLRTHCSNGHEFTPETAYLPPGGRGRQCRTCGNVRTRAYRARQRAVR